MVFRAQKHEVNPVAAFAQSNFKLLVGLGLGLLFLFAFLSPRSQGVVSWNTPVRWNSTGDPPEEKWEAVEKRGTLPGEEISTKVDTEPDTREENTPLDDAGSEGGEVSGEIASKTEEVESENEGALQANAGTQGGESEEEGVVDSREEGTLQENDSSGQDGEPGESGNASGEENLADGQSMVDVNDAEGGENSESGESKTEAEDSGLAENGPTPASKLLEGVSEAELVFAQQERGRIQCLQAIQRRIRLDYEPLFKGRSKIALVDVALHENLGDDILWRGPIKLAADFGQSIDYICVNSQRSWKGAAKNFPSCTVEKTVQVVKDGGLVMFHGGGNWGDLYRFVQTKRLAFLVKLTAALKDRNVKVLSLPQSIHYKAGSQHLAKDDAVLNSLPPNYFTLFLRQQDSYEIAKRHYKTIDAKLSPDIAFILGPTRPIGQPQYDILVLVRQDGEIRPEDKKIGGIVAQKAKAANVTHRIQDWWYKPHPGEFSIATVGAFSEVRTAEAIKIISQGKIVITNRLHATIVATLLGKTLFWVDTVQKKVSSTRSVAFSTSEDCTPENLHAVQTSTILEAVDQAIELLKQKEFVHN
ncbi:hypothetical protein BSKO_01990 [Bryopsis sp. KO-2023]|nr:hypothetical protein BSKO_01990 [Bryopsis sp. KO-2023]